MAAFPALIHYFPFWHQVTRGVSAVESGIRLLFFVISVVIMANSSEVFDSKSGYYGQSWHLPVLIDSRKLAHHRKPIDTPMMILSSIITPIVEGLLTTWTVDSIFSQWTDYQALTDLRPGFGQQQTYRLLAWFP
jgi:hypothetical protein